jgi:peptidoglycan/xylan/chitin deacetylase (PgdA/CDA1 family)
VEITKRFWPHGNQAAFTITVDDVHPEGSSDEEGIDYGGDMDQGNFRFLNTLIERRPYLKITLFVIADSVARPDYVGWKVLSRLDPIVSRLARVSPRLVRSTRAMMSRQRSYEQSRYRLDLEEHGKWRDWLASKVRTGNFEVVPHGLNHHNARHENSSMEFVGLSLEESMRRLLEMEQIFESASIPYTRGFRPPGWGTSQELLESLQKLRYVFLAGSADFKTDIRSSSTAAGVGLKSVQLAFPSKYAPYSFVTFCANCNTSAPERAIGVIEAGGLALFQTHIAKTVFGLEAVSRKFINVVSRLLDLFEREYAGRIWFASLGEIAEFCLGRDGTGINIVKQERSSLTLRVANTTPYDARGLTLDLGSENQLLESHSETLRAYVLDASKLVIDVPAGSDGQVTCALS